MKEVFFDGHGVQKKSLDKTDVKSVVCLIAKHLPQIIFFYVPYIIYTSFSVLDLFLIMTGKLGRDFNER